MQQKKYYKEIIISLITAITVGIAFNALIGLVSFFIIGSFLSKGSVPKEEMDKIMNDEPLMPWDEEMSSSNRSSLAYSYDDD